MMRSIRRVVAVLVATAFVASLCSVQAAAPVSAVEAVAPLPDDVDDFTSPMVLAGYFEEAFPDRYAGTWSTDEDGKEIVNFGWVDPGPVDERLLREMATISGRDLEGRLRLVDAERSVADMDEIQADLHDQLVEDGIETFVITEDPASQTFVVSTTEEAVDDLPAAIEDVDPSVVEAADTPVDVELTGQSLSSCPDADGGNRDLLPDPFLGSTRVYFANYSQIDCSGTPAFGDVFHRCLTAFGGHLDDGTEIGLTAGHCSMFGGERPAIMANASHDLSWVGNTLANSLHNNNTGTDALAFTIDADGGYGFHGVSAGTGWWAVSDVRSTSVDPEGDWEVCRSDPDSGEVCGDVITGEVEITLDDAQTVTDLDCFDDDTVVPGDSGGSVYVRNDEDDDTSNDDHTDMKTAVGVLVAAVGDKACYSPIGDVLTDLSTIQGQNVQVGTFETPGAITGTVMSRWGGFLPDTLVELFLWDDRNDEEAEPYRATATDEDGNFSFADLSPSDPGLTNAVNQGYFIKVIDPYPTPQYLTEVWNDALPTEPSEYRIVRVPPGGTTHVYPIIMSEDSVDDGGIPEGINEVSPQFPALDIDDFMADPVHTFSGQFTDSRRDLPAGGGAYGVAFERFYSSADTTVRSTGRGWSSILDVALTQLQAGSGADSDMELVMNSGRKVVFANVASNQWASPTGFGFDLSYDSTAEHYVVEFPDGDSWRFDTADDNRLTLLDDGQGQEVEVVWSTSAPIVIERLENVSAGRAVAFDYLEESTQLESAEAGIWDASESEWVPEDPARVVNYEYDSTDTEFLVDVSGVGGYHERFSASESGRIEKIEREIGEDNWELVVSSTYDDLNRVKYQQFPEGGTASFTYAGSDGQGHLVTTQTTDDGEGNRETLKFVHAVTGEVIGITDASGHGITRNYTEDDRNDEFTDRSGATSKVVYDSQGRVVRRFFPDPATGELPADFDDATSTQEGFFEEFTYVTCSNATICPADDSRVATHSQVVDKDGSTNVLAVTTYAYWTGSTATTNRIPIAVTAPGETRPTTSTVSGGLVVERRVPLGTGSDVVETDFYYGDDDTSIDPCPQRMLCSTVVAPGTAAESKTVYEYDDAGHRTAVIAAYGEAPGSGSPGETRTEYTFDDAGRLISEADPIALADPEDDHYPTRNGYDDAGRLLWTADPANPDTDGPTAAGGTDGYEPNVVYTYTSDGKVSSETRLIDYDSEGVPITTTTVSEYNGDGELTATLAAENTAEEVATTYEYGILGRLERTTEAAGTDAETVTELVYDANGRQTARIVDPGGENLVYRTGYDDAGRVACETDPLDAVPNYDGILDFRCLPAEHSISVEATGGTFDLWVQNGAANTEIADNAHNVSTGTLQTALHAIVNGTTVSGSAGYYVINWGDDQHHRVVVDDSSLTGGTTAVSMNRTFTAVHEYDAAGRQVRQVSHPGEAEQTTTETVFDEAGRVFQTLAETGVVGDTTGLAPWRYGVVEERHYDDGGRLIETVTPPPDVQTFTWNPANGLTTTNTYDLAGRLATVTTADGTADEVTVTYGYEAHGWKVSESDPADPALETTYSYDALGRVTGTTRPFGDNETTSQATAYLPTGQVYSQTDFAADPESAPTRFFGYNAGGQLWAAVDANETVTLFDYDLRGNKIGLTATQTLGEAPDCATAGTTTCIQEVWGYDEANRQISHTFPRDNTTTTTLTTEYDGAGRVVATSEPIASGVDREAAYTYTGHLLTGVDLSITGGAADELTFAYDHADRRTVATRDDGTDTYTTTYRYDTAGNLVATNNPVGGDATWGYAIDGNPRYLTHLYELKFSHDNQRRIAQTALYFDTWYVWVPLADYDYDDAGRLTHEIYINNPVIYVDYDRDDAGNLTRYLSDLNGTEIHDYHLTWNPDGRVASECNDTSTTSTCTGTTTDYIYDPAGQLRGQGTGCEWDGDNPDSGCTATWAYDGAGNRTHQTKGATEIAFTPNEANQVTEVAIDGGNTTTLAYNWAGERTSLVESNGSTEVASYDYNWGPNGHLSDVEGTSIYFGPWAQDFTHDAADNLVKVDFDNGNNSTIDHTFELLWDPSSGIPQIIDALFDGTIHNVQNYGVRRITNQETWYVYDWLNSAIESAEIPDNPTSYDAFGGAIGLGSLMPFFGYRGEFVHTAAINLRNRDYDPGTGTFLQRDPLDGVPGTPTVANAYHYVDNDPLNKADPLGLSPEEDALDPPVAPGDPDDPDIPEDDWWALAKIAGDLLRGSFNDSAARGSCLDVGVDFWGPSITAGTCLVDDGNLIGSVVYTGMGVGAGASGTATAGAIVSNAGDLRDLAGDALCGSIGGGTSIAVSGSLCLSLTQPVLGGTEDELRDLVSQLIDQPSLLLTGDGLYSGTMAVYAGVGLGIGGLSGGVQGYFAMTDPLWDYRHCRGPLLNNPLTVDLMTYLTTGENLAYCWLRDNGPWPF